MSLVAYRSRRCLLPDGEQAATLVCDPASGLITDILDYDVSPMNTRLFDAGASAILPGLIDPHVHVNEPGRTDWEGFATATLAAAAGGITTLIDMPLNCLPPTTSVAALTAKREAAQGQTHVDWRPWAGAVGDLTHPGNHEHLEALAAAGVAGFKCFLLDPGCAGMGLIDEPALRLALPCIARTGLPLLVHAELAGPCDAAAKSLIAQGADWTRYATYLASRPDEAEIAAVKRMIALCREFGARVHIVHVSSAQVLPLLRTAKAEGLPITAETCPHYLVFSAEQIEAAQTETAQIASVGAGATLYKCAPPIRSAANQALLWQALEDGTLDLIASDHSPCPPAMKGLAEGNFQTAWGGIAGLSQGLPVVWTAMRERGLPLTRLVEWMATAPARLAGVSAEKGTIQVGFCADFVIFNTTKTHSTTTKDMHFRHPISPYVGHRVTGVVEQTILRGEVVYRQGEFPNPGRGREVRRRPNKVSRRPEEVSP